MHFLQETTWVLATRQLARDTYCVRLGTPRIAAAIRPGQFIMLRLPGTTDPLLGRPFALYDTVLDDAGKPIAIDIVYLVVGKLTRKLAELSAGDELEVWGPLGNGFQPTRSVSEASTLPTRSVSEASTLPTRSVSEASTLPTRSVSEASTLPTRSVSELPPSLTRRVSEGIVYLVAGGIGQTPFLAYIRDLLGTRGYGGAGPCAKADRVSLFYGVRSKDLAAGVDDFQSAGAAVHLASDDGTVGFHGFVTALVEQHPPPQHMIGCGPEPMMHALAKLAQSWNVPCHLSLESPMACGVGVCFSCVTRVHVADGWDYRRVCVDGPVFDAAKLVW